MPNTADNLLAEVFRQFEENHGSELTRAGFYKKYSERHQAGGYFFGTPNPTAYIQFFAEPSEPNILIFDVFCKDPDTRSALNICAPSEQNQLGHQRIKLDNATDIKTFCLQVRQQLTSEVVRSMIKS